MTPEDLEKYLAPGYEGRGYEFKGSRPRTDVVLFARVTRAALGMANLPGGGVIIVGVNEGANHAIEPVGLNDADLATWNFDDVAAGVGAAADPRVGFDLEVVPQGDRRFIVLTIHEFDIIPVLCSRDFSNPGEVILRKGALYVRGHGKPETSEVASQTAMREVLDLAIDKGVRTFMARVYRANVLVAPPPLPAQPADIDQFQAELEDPNA